MQRNSPRMSEMPDLLQMTGFAALCYFALIGLIANLIPTVLMAFWLGRKLATTEARAAAGPRHRQVGRLPDHPLAPQVDRPFPQAGLLRAAPRATEDTAFHRPLRFHRIRDPDLRRLVQEAVMVDWRLARLDVRPLRIDPNARANIADADAFGAGRGLIPVRQVLALPFQGHLYLQDRLPLHRPLHRWDFRTFADLLFHQAHATEMDARIFPAHRTERETRRLQYFRHLYLVASEERGPMRAATALFDLDHWTWCFLRLFGIPFISRYIDLIDVAR